MKPKETLDYVPVPQLQSDEDEREQWKSSSIKHNGSTDISEKSFVNEKLKDGDDVVVDPGPMSPLRKLCFVLSILLCVFFVIAFAWLIPCKLPLYVGKEKPLLVEWVLAISVDNMVLSTNLESVPGITDARPVVFGIKSITNESINSPSLMSIEASVGHIMWHVELPSQATSVSCHEIDINGDKVLDCMVLGNGFLMLINGTDGHIFWKLLSDAFSSPVVVADCDEDSVVDIAVFSSSPNVSILVLSGLSGKTISSLPVHQCNTLPKVAVSRKMGAKDLLDIVFSCVDDQESEHLWSISVEDLCQSKTLKTKINLIQVSGIDQIADFRLLTVPVGESRDNMIVWNETNIVLLQNQNYSVKWTFSISPSTIIRTVTVGNFYGINTTDVAVSITENGEPSQILVLDAFVGDVQWNQTYENGTVTLLMNIPKLFSTQDGLLLKSVGQLKLPQSSEVKTVEIKYFERSTHFEEFLEQYGIVECTNSNTVSIVASKIASRLCSGSKCSPDIFSSVNTVAVVHVSNGRMPSLVVASTSMVNNNGTIDEPPQQELQLRLVDLSTGLHSVHCKTPCDC